MVKIYVLKLKEGKYYIGKANNISNRMNQHIEGKGSEWCKLYSMVDIEAVYKDCDAFDEDKYTKVYMDKYGIDNVRGGSYCQIELSTCQKELLNRELQTANDLCWNCGKSGHFISSCHNDLF